MRFFSKPTLGGWLTIANGVAWILILVLPELVGNPNVFALFIPIGLLLSFPFVWCWCLFPSLGGPTIADVVEIAIVFGLNSIAWGYGVAWIVRRYGW